MSEDGGIFDGKISIRHTVEYYEEIEPKNIICGMPLTSLMMTNLKKSPNILNALPKNESAYLKES